MSTNSHTRTCVCAPVLLEAMEPRLLLAAGPLTQKFITQLTMSTADFRERQLHPVMGDIDNDGTQEIVLTAGENLYAINGKTGQIEWTVQGNARESAVELADLNNDGVPEILYGLTGTRLRAVRGNGTILWTTPKLRGADHPMFPILTADINGDGYPTIYFLTEDQSPNPYSGNLADYTGAINVIDHTGKVQPQHAWLFHPCWGGASLADVNNDGRYEIFVSDRRNGYNGVPAHGLAAFDAQTLEMLWSRGDIHHSSPAPILADVNKDGKLDVVAQKIVSKGPMVLNAMTGATMKDYSNRGLPVHGTGTVYDIDQDGNLEILLGTGYSGVKGDVYNVANEFAVFDLVTGTTDFRPQLDFPATWPPRVGDVTGDGEMEILAAMGFQWDRTGTSPLLVYDSNYNLIQRIDIYRSGQLSPAKVFDTDGDGLNEVVVVGKSGKLVVFDTPAQTPNPAPRTWVQMYSERRDNVPVYVAPPGGNTANTAPVISNPSPGNNSTGVPLGAVLSANIQDGQNDRMNLTFELGTPGNGGSYTWQTIKTYANVLGGTYTAATDGLLAGYNTTYRWRVTAVDTAGKSTQTTYTFTTASAPTGNWYGTWDYRRQLTVSGQMISGSLANYPLLVDVTLSSLASNAQSDADDILFTSADGVTKLSHEVESYNAATGHLVAWVRLPGVSSGSSTLVYMYYGNASAADQSGPQATWDSAYRAVEHFEEISGPVTDSTGNLPNGTALNGVIQGAAGIIGSGYSFDGVNDRVSLGQVFGSQSAFTIEGWVNPGDKQGYIFNQRSGSTGVMLQYYASSGQFEAYVGSTRLVAKAVSGSWYHIALTYTGGTARLYLDGQQVASASASLSWPATSSYVGDKGDGTRQFLGRIDEMRFSTTARSADYLATVYRNRAGLGVYLDVGQQEIRT